MGTVCSGFSLLRHMVKLITPPVCVFNFHRWLCGLNIIERKLFFTANSWSVISDVNVHIKMYHPLTVWPFKVGTLFHWLLLLWPGYVFLNEIDAVCKPCWTAEISPKLACLLLQIRNCTHLLKQTWARNMLDKIDEFIRYFLSIFVLFVSAVLIHTFSVKVNYFSQKLLKNNRITTLMGHTDQCYDG